MVDGRLPALGAIVVTLVSCGVAVAAPNQPSASYFMPGCRDAASLITFSVRESEEGLGFMGELHGICLPPDTTSQQATSIVVQYIDGQPARTDEDFRSLAIEALRANWPCSPTNPSGQRPVAG